MEKDDYANTNSTKEAFLYHNCLIC